MCGIVGYIGSRQAQPILLDGLAHLEYRGYDSAGIAVMSEDGIQLRKSKGKLQNLSDLLSSYPLSGCAGIGHTRWATHGVPSNINAHPHTDMHGSIAVVHNGIIENHDELRRQLQSKGCVFTSETDTEVIAHLLANTYDGDMVQALRQVQAQLSGSYAVCVLNAHEPDAIYCMRMHSPLVIGLGQGEQFVASDIPALIAHTRQAELLADTEIAVLQASHVTVFDSCGKQRSLHPLHVDWDIEAAEKGGYPHFMLKEIHEEPEALKKTFSAYVDLDTLSFRSDAFPVTEEVANTITGMTIVACGTAYHAGMIGKYIIEKLVRIPVSVDIASEFRYREPVLNKNELFLAVSQSGETADTLAAMQEAHRNGLKTMALTNVVGSSIARAAGNNVIYTYAGPEIAVASTKAYITQVEVLILLALDLAVKRGQMLPDQAHAFLDDLSSAISNTEGLLQIANEVQRFSALHHHRQHIFFIGRGIDTALAMEASLKLKEVSYIMSEAYAAGELKHGTISLIEDNILVVGSLTQPDLYEKTVSNMVEVKSRGASLMAITTYGHYSIEDLADFVVYVPKTDPHFLTSLAIIPLQLLAYYTAVARGEDVDKPRNLAKSVTVE